MEKVSQEALKEEGAIIQPRAEAAPVKSSAVSVHLTEETDISLDSDGGIKKVMTVQGELMMTVMQGGGSKRPLVRLTKLPLNSNFQFKVHPFINRNALFDQNLISLQEGGADFPTDTPTPVVRWRLQSQNENDLPLRISCWPSLSSQGKAVHATVEYELVKLASVSDVVISIPIVSKSAPIVDIGDSDSSYKYDTRNNQLIWSIPSVDSSSPRGTLQLDVETWGGGDGTSWLFPIRVQFVSTALFCDFDVEEVTEDDKPVLFSTSKTLKVQNFTVG